MPGMVCSHRKVMPRRGLRSFARPPARRPPAFGGGYTAQQGRRHGQGHGQGTAMHTRGTWPKPPRTSVCEVDDGWVRTRAESKVAHGGITIP